MERCEAKTSKFKIQNSEKVQEPSSRPAGGLPQENTKEHKEEKGDNRGIRECAESLRREGKETDRKIYRTGKLGVLLPGRQRSLGSHGLVRCERFGNCYSGRTVSMIKQSGRFVRPLV